MSYISDDLWKSEFDTPKPTDITYQQFVQIVAQKDIRDNLDYTTDLINQLQSLPPTPDITEWIQREQVTVNETYRRLAL